MARSVSIIRVLSCVAVLAAMSCTARADDQRMPRKKPPAATEEPKYKIDFGDAPTSNSPAPPPGTAPLRRDPDSGIPFLGLKLSKPLGD